MSTRHLTELQRSTLRRMAEGWELYVSGGLAPRVHIQEGGAGRGGRSITVRSSTWGVLLDRGLIYQAGRGPGLGHVYALTETGKIEAAR